jgi:hypothetical protein
MDADPWLLECFTTSDLVRSVKSGKTYRLYPAGDYGLKREVMQSAYSRYYIDTDSIYYINSYDERSYEAGQPLY